MSRRDKKRIRVNVEQSPVEIAKQAARSFDPTLSDEQIAQGLRELAGQIEAESLNGGDRP
jgi:hypothetical protein